MKIAKAAVVEWQKASLPQIASIRAIRLVQTELHPLLKRIVADMQSQIKAIRGSIKKREFNKLTQNKRLCNQTEIPESSKICCCIYSTKIAQQILDMAPTIIRMELAGKFGKANWRRIRKLVSNLDSSLSSSRSGASRKKFHNAAKGLESFSRKLASSADKQKIESKPPIIPEPSLNVIENLGLHISTATANTDKIKSSLEHIEIRLQAGKQSQAAAAQEIKFGSKEIYKDIKRISKELARSMRVVRYSLNKKKLSDLVESSIHKDLQLPTAENVFNLQDIPSLFEQHNAESSTSCSFGLYIQPKAETRVSKMCSFKLSILGNTINELVHHALKTFEKVGQHTGSIFVHVCQGLDQFDQPQKQILFRVITQGVVLPHGLESGLIEAIHKPYEIKNRKGATKYQKTLANLSLCLSDKYLLPGSSLSIENQNRRLVISFKIECPE